MRAIAHKLRDCICGGRFYPERPFQKACSVTCAIELANAKEVANEAKRLRIEKREGRLRLMTLSQLCAAAQKDVNRFIRLRDFGKGCISCPTGKVSDAGHRFHAGTKYRTNRIRFDHRCLNGQCEDCNRYNGGRPADYDAGYAARYGAEALAELHELKRQADRGELPPLERDEVGRIAAEHRRLARELMATANRAMLA